jgi:hypothetical protein
VDAERGGVSNWPINAPGALTGPWGYTDASNQFRTLPTFSAANAKTAWVELTPPSSRAVESGELRIVWTNTSGSNNTILFDLAVGSPGLERILIADVALHINGSGFLQSTMPLPRIPAGAALYARAQSRLTVVPPPAMQVIRSAVAFASTMPFGEVRSYGTHATETRGPVAVSCTGTATGATVELIAALPRRCRGLLLSASAWSEGSGEFRVRLYRGASLTVSILSEPIHTMYMGALLWVPVTLPAGERVGISIQSNTVRTIYPTIHTYH